VEGSGSRLNTENNNQLDLEKKDETFTAAEKEEFASFSERILRLKNAIERVAPLAMSLRNADDPPYGTVVPPTYVQIRGDFDLHGEMVDLVSSALSRATRILRSFPSIVTNGTQPRPPDHARQLDRQSG